MARKDVDLVIRAKDQATKVVDSITQAVNEFTSAQADLVSTSGKTGSTLAQLGQAVGKLEKELSGLSISQRVGQEFDRANAAAERLNTQFTRTQTEAKELAQALNRAETATARLQSKTSGAATAQQRAVASLKKQKDAQAELTRELGKATTARDRLIGQESRLASSIEKQEQKVADITAKYERLGQEIKQSAQPTKTLQRQLDTASTSMQKQGARLDELRSKYAQSQREVVETEQSIRRLSGQLERTSADVARQERVVAKISSNYKQLQVAAKDAGRSQREISDAVDKNAEVLSRQSDKINRAEKELIELGEAAGKADAAFQELASRSGANLEKAFTRQRRAALEAKREWTELTQEATKLATQISRVGVPTREMADSFNKARQAAATSKQEYIEQRNALQLLRNVMSQSVTDVASLAQQQQRFSSIVDRTSQQIQKIRTAAQTASGGYNALTGAANRSNAAVRRSGTVAASAAGGMSQAAQQTRNLAQAYRSLYGESRQAMSWTQRLRGEVLSLIAAYGGIYGVINLLGQTVDAYQTLEAATSRLNVAFDGDTGRVNQELDFLRRNANRLGIEFGALASEYAKFAVATQGTNLEGENTRKIFISVAEAARVNKSSFDEMRGVFTALTQIVSKGAVQMEELRQQLGDRLPGALRLMADGLGVTTAELVKMMEQGQVSADALVPFAEELDRRFGPGLQDALKTTTTAMGQLRNAVFQALVQFGKAGFLESFNDLLAELTETIQSADFQSFAARVSQAFAVLVDVITVAVDNFDLLVVAASAFVGVKLVPFVTLLIAQFTRLRVSTLAAATGIGTARASLTATTGAVSAATVAFRGLTIAIRALLSSTGIGLAVVAISTAIGYWATRTDDATAALTQHQKVVDAVRNAYDKVGDSVKDWAQEVKNLSVTQAQANLATQRSTLQDVRDTARPVADAFGVDTVGTVTQLNNAIAAFKEGRISAQQFKNVVDEIAQADPKLNRNIASKLLETADAAIEAEKRVAEANDALTAITGTAEEQKAALDRLAGATNDNAVEQRRATNQAEKFKEALSGLDEITEGLNQTFENLKAREKLEEAYNAALQLAQGMGDVQRATDAYNEGLARIEGQEVFKEFGSFTDGQAASAALLRQFEGFRATPYFDVNAYRAGFGSDTVTLADGTIKKITTGMRVSVEDANRDLRRRVQEFQNVVKGQIGEGRFSSFSPQQQAALTSIAYNYGEIPDRIAEVVRTGTTEQIAQAIRGLQNDNGGINRGRRRREAALFESGTNVENLARAEEQDAARRAQEEEKAAEARRQFHEEQQKSIEDTQFELSLENQKLVAREQAKAIRDAENAAKEAGTELTEAERQKILETVEAKFRQKQIEEETNAVKDRAAQAEERVNQLLQQRSSLEQQLQIYRDQGDQGKVQETEAELARVNEQLQAAIANAQQMWAAVGGGAADTAITKLQTASLEAQNFKAQAQQSYFSWDRVGQLFTSGLTNAFDQFAQAVANGEDAGEAAQRAFLQFASDFLRQIAQMIIQQAIFNALQSFGFGGGGGGGGGLFGGILSAFGHTGGVVGAKTVGSGNKRRRVNPMVFAGADYFHDGGLPGLRPGEVPLIAKKGEEVLSEDDPRNVLNGAAQLMGQSARAQDVKVINALDSGSFVDEGMNTKQGQRAILNFLRANSRTVKSILND